MTKEMIILLGHILMAVLFLVAYLILVLTGNADQAKEFLPIVSGVALYWFGRYNSTKKGDE